MPERMQQHRKTMALVKPEGSTYAIRERRTEDESRTNSRRDGSRERDVFSKSEKWLLGM